MHKHDVKKIVFSSTAATYGEPKPKFRSKKLIRKFQLTLLISLPWKKSCIESDVAYGIKFIALRYFNVAGAKPDGSIGEDHHPETHLVQLFCKFLQVNVTNYKFW